jgi:HK97 family phage portal protein
MLGLGALTSWLRPSAVKAAEGQYRPGPYALSDGWLSAAAGQSWNWWQQGYSLNPYGSGSAMVEACVSAYAQTVAMCPGDHWQSELDGGRTRVAGSALSRILRHPNDYESISDFFLNLTRRLYTAGEAFAVGIRNGREEIAELHLMRKGAARIAEDGSIFYSLDGNEILEKRFDFTLPVPARDVLHVRLQTPRHPLKGESPILSTVLDQALGGAVLNQQINYYLNQARPSYILETAEKLTPEQVKTLRELWDIQTKGAGAGGTPILTWGLSAKPQTGNAEDGQLADILKLSDQNIALAFRMPLQVLGLGGAPFSSTEALMSAWKATGLGFALNHIEESFGLLFGLRGYPDEYLELDTEALLRSAFKERIEGLVRGVQGGVFAPNEARRRENLAAAPFGDEPRVQEQVVPLSFGARKEPNPTPAAPAAPAGKPADDGEGDGDANGGDDAGDGPDPGKLFADIMRHAEHARLHVV